MGDVIKHRRPGKARRSRGRSPPIPRRPKRPPFGYVQAMLATLGVSAGVLIGMAWFGWIEVAKGTGGDAIAADITCSMVEVLDGDTFDCDGERIRLHGIDSPELPGHCRRGRDCAPGDPFASTANLERLVAAGTVQCEKVDTDVYGRTVARCTAEEADLSYEQIEGGHAIRRYGVIFC